jgi:hypothetical protein
MSGSPRRGDWHERRVLAGPTRAARDSAPTERPRRLRCRWRIRPGRGRLIRFDLVLRILVTTHDLLEREGLIDAALSAHIALLTSEGRAERRRDATYLERFATRRDLLTFRVTELRAAQEARAVVEARYLAGHTALFPDAVKAWDEQLRSTETLTDVACRLAELDGVPPAEPADSEAASVRVTDLVADLVEPAKATALEKLGEGEHSRAIAIGWLRPKLERVAAVTDLAT